MLNTNYCVPDEKYSRKHVYVVYFSCMKVLERKKDKNTANAALNRTYPLHQRQTDPFKKLRIYTCCRCPVINTLMQIPSASAGLQTSPSTPLIHRSSNISPVSTPVLKHHPQSSSIGPQTSPSMITRDYVRSYILAYGFCNDIYQYKFLYYYMYKCLQ